MSWWVLAGVAVIVLSAAIIAWALFWIEGEDDDGSDD